VRTPYADVEPLKIPKNMDVDDAVLLTDVAPIGYQAAEMGGIKQGDTVVIFGAGPVGIMAVRCSWLFGVSLWRSGVGTLVHAGVDPRNFGHPPLARSAINSDLHRGSARKPDEACLLDHRHMRVGVTLALAQHHEAGWPSNSASWC